MSLSYFNPSDLQQFEATFNYVSKSGAGFAIIPSNEQVFITGRLVDQLGLNIGDTLRVWAVDNQASAETAHFASRWRAVRVEIVMRIADAVRAATIAASAQPSAPIPPTPTPVGDLAVAVQARLDLLRPWAVNEMAHDISKARTFTNTPDLTQKVGTRLSALHRNGDIAMLKVFARGTQASASAVYYAKNVDVFYDHLDTPLEDE